MADRFSELLLRRADDALVLGHRLSEWTGHAPTLEEELALANLALDLIGQARALYALAAARGTGEDEDALAYPVSYTHLDVYKRQGHGFAIAELVPVHAVVFDSQLGGGAEYHLVGARSLLHGGGHHQGFQPRFFDGFHGFG